MATLKQYLTSIGQEMIAQDNRATQHVMFVIMVKQKDYKNYVDDWEHRERPNLDAVDEEKFERDLCKVCKDMYAEHGEVKDECDDCDFDAWWYYNLVDTVDVNPGIFFTAAACQQHIDENKHHYFEPSVYGISAWRNPEMQAVQKYLIGLTGQELPSHYQGR